MTVAKRMGWVFHNCLGVANEATKKLKIKIDDVRNKTINQKQAALTDDRWDVTSE